MELVTPDIHVATITDKKTEFEVEITVEKGLGYIPVEQRTREKLEIGTIALDAIFTPVKKVNFEVENMRVGDRTDFNKLNIYIETDGSITPKDSFMEATKMLVEQYSEILDLVYNENAIAQHSAKSEEEGAIKKDDRIKISDLNISLRTINALEKGAIYYLDELNGLSPKEIKGIKGLGEKGLKEITKELHRLGYMTEEQEQSQ